MGRRWRERDNVLTRAAGQPEGQAGVVLTKRSVPGILEEEPEDQCGARATEAKQGDQTIFFFFAKTDPYSHDAESLWK